MCVDDTLVEAAQIPWRPIGELFVEKGLISEEQLEGALAEQAATGRRLGEILVKQNLISSPELTQVLMEQLGREVAKEEGFGTGLWAEIHRRNAQPGSDPVLDTSDGDRSPFGEGLTRKLALVGEDEPAASEPAGSPAIESADLEELSESLTEAQVEIEMLRQGLAERDQRLEALGTELGSVGALEGTLAAAQDELGSHRARVEELERALVDRDGRIAELQTTVGELESALSDAGGKASELVAALTAERQTHGETRQRLDEAARAEQDAKQALLEIERGFEAAHAERDASRSEAAVSREALSERESELAELRDQVAAADAALADEREAHQDTCRQAEQAATEAARTRHALDGLEQERRELADRARTLEEELASRQGTQSHLEEQLETAQRRALELSDEVAGVSDQLEEVRQERDELAQRARSLEEAENDRAAARAEAEDATAKLHEAEARIAEAAATVDRLEGEKAELSKTFSEQRLALERELGELGARLAEESAAHSETRCVLSQALDDLAVREPIPLVGSEGEPSPQDYLCFAPTKEGYRLLARAGLLPEAGDGCDVDGVAHVVTRVARSPLPFDARMCAYLIAL